MGSASCVDNIVQFVTQYMPSKGSYTIDFQDLVNLHLVTIPDSGSLYNTIALSYYNNAFYGSNSFLQALTLNNYLGSTAPFTGNMFILAPANGVSYTIQATNPATLLTYSIKDMGANADFVLTNGSQTLTNKTLNLNSSSQNFVNAQVSGDIDYWFSLDNSGDMNFGPGNATQDMKLERTGASILSLTGKAMLCFL